MQYDFFFWWSVVSTILSIIFLIISVWQYLEGQKQQERHKAQVKVWMHDSNGIHWGLTRIVQDNLDKRYTSTNDIANAVWAVEAMSFSLYQSLYEERCVTEKEYAEEQKELREQSRTQAKGQLSETSKPK